MHVVLTQKPNVPSHCTNKVLFRYSVNSGVRKCFADLGCGDRLITTCLSTSLTFAKRNLSSSFGFERVISSLWVALVGMTTSMPFDKVNGRNVRRMVATGKNRVHTISISYYGCLRNGQIVRPSSCCVSQRKLELSILCILSIPGFRPAFLSTASASSRRG